MTSLANINPTELLAAAKDADIAYEAVVEILRGLPEGDPRREKVEADARTLGMILDTFMAEINRQVDVARKVQAVFEGSES